MPSCAAWGKTGSICTDWLNQEVTSAWSFRKLTSNLHIHVRNFQSKNWPWLSICQRKNHSSLGFNGWPCSLIPGIGLRALHSPILCLCYQLLYNSHHLFKWGLQQSLAYWRVQRLDLLCSHCRARLATGIFFNHLRGECDPSLINLIPQCSNGISFEITNRTKEKRNALASRKKPKD